MENLVVKFELKSPMTPQESQFNTLVLLLRELKENLDVCFSDYEVNDILNRIKLEAENMKINIKISVKLSITCNDLLEVAFDE